MEEEKENGKYLKNKCEIEYNILHVFLQFNFIFTVAIQMQEKKENGKYLKMNFCYL